MSCSKIFSGDLPELLNEIMIYLKDVSTLHSCVLVNRIWCRMAIPLIWEEPFLHRDYRVIDCFLHNLSEDEKLKLKEYGINSELLPSNTLFNYPSFIKRLNTKDMLHCIKKWVAFSNTLTTYNKQKSILHNSTKLIYKSLFKMFIENKVNLHTFKIKIITDEFFNNIIELILQNPNFIHNVKNLMICISYKYSNNLTKIESFLSLLSYNNNTFSSLYFQFGNFDNINEYTTRMINSQKNLQKIIFRSNDYPLYESLLSLKNSNCSNTLKTIIFYQIDFSNIFIFKEVFEQLNVLDSIHILYCYPIDSSIIKQIINLTKPFKLKSLFMNENSLSRSDQLKLLLQKSGDYLENIRLEGSIINNIKLQLFELVQIYCINIKYIDLYEFDDQNIHSVFDLIKNKQQNLNYLSINFYGFNYYHELSYDDKLSSFILHNLGQILPYRLEYLSLVLRFDINDLEIFFSNSQTIFIRKLLISSKSYQNILPCIKKYVMKEKMVAYLAIEYLLPHNGEIKDLFYSKDEVDEFKFYDIQVTSHNDLCSKIHDFINEL
jgi:hypothetical protein